MNKKKNQSEFKQILAKDISTLRLVELVKLFSSQRIVVLGDLGVDRYTLGQVERISPEAPVPIVWVQEEKYKLGLAANVGENIVVLGGEPALVGVIGKDSFGKDFLNLLKKTKISSRGVVTDLHRRTVLKDRIVSDRQQLLRVDYESAGNISGQTEKKILKVLKSQILSSDALLLEDYAKGLLGTELCKVAIQLARSKKKRIGVDPNSKSPLSLYRGCTFMTPNTKEAEALTGFRIVDNASLIKVGRKLISETEAEFVIITRGREGMAIFERDSMKISILPTYAKEVYDVSGAGDTVISILTLALSAGATIEEAAVLGNLGAGVVVGKRGTATVNPSELIQSIHGWKSFHEPVMNK